MKKLICTKLLTVFAVNLFIVPAAYCGKKHFKKQQKAYRQKNRKRTRRTFKQMQKIQKKQDKVRNNKRIKKKKQQQNQFGKSDSQKIKSSQNYRNTRSKNLLKKLFFASICLNSVVATSYDDCYPNSDNNIICCNYFDEIFNQEDLGNFDVCITSGSSLKCCDIKPGTIENNQLAYILAIPTSICLGLTFQALLVYVFGKQILHALRAQSKGLKDTRLASQTKIEMESSTTSEAGSVSESETESATEGQTENTSETSTSESAY